MVIKPKIRLKVILVGFLLLYIPFLLHSQPDNLKFKHISVENGLSQNSVWSIVQDKTGFMWFGTDFGLNEYNGYNFRIFKALENRLSISADRVEHLFVDSYGLIWMGLANGVNVFDRSNYQIRKYSYNTKDTNSLLNNSTVAIFEDAYRNVWICNTAGLNMYDRKNDIFYHLIPPTTFKNSFTLNIVSASIDKKGNILIGYPSLYFDKIFITKNLSLNFYANIPQLKIQSFHFPLKFRDNTSFLIRKIYQDNDGNTWFATTGAGLLRIKSLDTISQTYSFTSDRFIIKNNFDCYRHNIYDVGSICNNTVNDIYQDKSGNLWIATDGGLNIFNYEKNIFKSYTNDPSNPTSLSNDHVYSIYEDKSNNLWFGTHSGGVNIYDGGKNNIKLYRSNPSEPGALKNDMVSAIHEDSKGVLWIGSKYGLNEFYKNSKSSSLFVNDPNDPNSISNNTIMSICSDHHNRIWIGTKEGGLNLFNEKKRNFIRYNKYFEEKGINCGKVIRALYCDKNNILWIGSNSGLLKFDTDHNTCKLYSNKTNSSSEISNNYIWSIFEDKDENLWIGTVKGMNLFLKKEEKFVRFIYQSDSINFDKNNLIISITQDKHGIIWAGSFGGGVFKIVPVRTFNESGQEILNFTHPSCKLIHHTFGNTLDNEHIYGLIYDSEENIWISTYNGLWKFNQPKNVLRLFDTRDGLQDNEFNSGAYFKSKDGEIYFGGCNGFNSFYTRDLKDNTHIPNVVLTNFKKFDKSVDFNKDISEVSEIELTYKDNYITFEFASLDFTEPQKNQYAYMLEGFDQTWIQSGTRRYASYTNLPGGEYVFKVKATNNSGLWNDIGMSIKIRVVPPVWNTAWFKLSSVFLALGLILFLFNLRLKTLEKQRTKLEAIVEERTKKLKESNDTKDLLFSIIGHDLRSPIGFIKSTTELISESTDSLTEEDYRDFFNGIKSSANNTFNLLENLLSWAESQKGTIIFKPESIELNSLIRASMDLIKGNAVQKSINLNFSPDNDFYVFCDKNMIMTVFRNLLSNALKFTNEGGEIKVESVESGNFINITVADSGIGISEETQKKLFQQHSKFTTKGTKGEKGTGLGLILCKEFIEANGGKIWIDSKPGVGTKFIFSLPKSKEI
jgi:signal transduction histidine kinase/ligand-binding sensor domain-containing protein